MENIGIGGLIGRGLTLEHNACYFVHYTAERIVIVYYTAKRRDVLGRTMYIPDDQDISRGPRNIQMSLSAVHPH